VRLANKLRDKELLDLLLDKPDLFLDEMQYFLASSLHVVVSPETIRRHLASADFTNKRLQLEASQRNPELRSWHVLRIADFGAEMLVYCDESGLDKRDGARRTGWSPRGVAARSKSAFRRGKRFHLLPAITIDGLLDVLVYEGHTETEGFLAWLRLRLLPKMNRFPAPNSVLVMDNASWHRDKRTRTLCAEFGVLLIYLPPYSPDLNPIEAYFSDLKALVRREYRYWGGDDQNNDEFKAFLINMARQVAARTTAIRGHFRKAYVAPPRELTEYEYAVEYDLHLLDLIEERRLLFEEDA
jgi:transposase